MYPLKFETIFKSVVWGGEKIAPFKGVETDQHNIGESWELSGVKGNESVVAEGPLAGKTITELAAEYKGALLGEKVYAKNGTEFPLYMSGAGQYSFLDQFAGEEVTLEIALCNWNDKTDKYRGCILAVITDDGKVYNELNFNS